MVKECERDYVLDGFHYVIVQEYVVAGLKAKVLPHYGIQ